MQAAYRVDKGQQICHECHQFQQAELGLFYLSM